MFYKNYEIYKIFTKIIKMKNIYSNYRIYKYKLKKIQE